MNAPINNPTEVKEEPVDERVLELYNEYAHGRIDRREFVRKVNMLAIGGVSATALIESVMPQYAKAQTVMFTDPRIRAEYVEYPSPLGSGMMRGYLVRPMEVQGRAPAVLVIHENRGLNPYIEDVARRAATQGFLALAPDGLTPVGGYPGNDDYGRTLQAQLDDDKLDRDMFASARFLKSHADSNGMLGATGFCWGGGMTNRIAAELGGDLNAGVPFYGAPVLAEQAANIEAALLLTYAEDDNNINSRAGEYQDALRANGVTFEAVTYPGTMHGFHNNSTPRFVPEQAAAAEARMWDWFRTHLA
jgi:carboxymethylenebutenolidase